jgi:tetratricopeptide (TPR) repeat protein
MRVRSKRVLLGFMLFAMGFVLGVLTVYARQQSLRAAVIVERLNDQGRKLYVSGDLQGAARTFEKAFRAGPNTPAGAEARRNLGITWNQIGLRAVERGDFKGAEGTWTRVLDIDPNNYDATYNLSHLYDRLTKGRVLSNQQ